MPSSAGAKRLQDPREDVALVAKWQKLTSFLADDDTIVDEVVANSGNDTVADEAAVGAGAGDKTVADEAASGASAGDKSVVDEAAISASAGAGNDNVAATLEEEGCMAHFEPCRTFYNSLKLALLLCCSCCHTFLTWLRDSPAHPASSFLVKCGIK